MINLYRGFISLLWAVINLIPEATDPMSSVERFYDNKPHEKIYLVFDQPHYAYGDTLNYQVFVLNADDHTPTQWSRQVAVDLLDEKHDLLISQQLLLSSGIALGSLHLPPIWTAREITVGVRTPFSAQTLNEYSYQIILPMTTDSQTGKSMLNGGKISMHFYPESGTWVEDLPAVLGFKAMDEQGNGLNVRGIIKDSKGQLATEFSALKFGLGLCRFVPQAGETYHAQLEYAGKNYVFDLPTIQQKGFTMHCTPRGSAAVNIVVNSNKKEGTDGSYLIGHVRGTQLFRWDQFKGPISQLRLSLDSFPSGIMQLTLFDRNNIPQCERLIFVHHTSSVSPWTQLKGVNQDYSTRSLVTWSFYTGHKAMPTPWRGNYAITVTDSTLLPWTPWRRTIQSYLWLESDLKGHIENPGYYFEKQDAERIQMLDVLLRVQGWRRFIWQDILQDTAEVSEELSPQEGLAVAGKVVERNSRHPVEAEVFCTTLNPTFNVWQTRSATDGSFSFSGLHFLDTLEVILEARPFKDKKGRKDEKIDLRSSSRYDIMLSAQHLPALDSSRVYRLPPSDELIRQNYSVTRVTLQRIDSMYAAEWSVDLQEVEVTAQKIHPAVKYYQKSILYREPDLRILADQEIALKSYGNLFEYLRFRVPGVEVRGSFPDYEIFMRGISSISQNNAAGFMINGAPVSKQMANSIDPNHIAFIDILKGLSSTAVYGEFGRGGVVAIYTKAPGLVNNDHQHVPTPGISTFRIPGFFQAKQFYLPVYDQPKKASDKPDLRTHLFWQGQVIPDSSGLINLSFYTGDRTGTFQVLVEGLDAAFEPVVWQGSFKVK